MLYLPLGIRNFLSQLALKRNENLGQLLIQVACKWAWENGFKCDHPEEYMISEPQESTKRRKPVRKCKICGMLFTSGAKRRDGSNIPLVLGYPIVSFVGER